MTLEHGTFRKVLAQAEEVLKDRLPEWRTPSFFLHFGAKYEMRGLFDDTPTEFPLHCLSDDLADRPNLDGETACLQYGLCDGVPILAAIGTRRLAEGDGLLSVLFPTALAATIGVKNHIFLDTALSLTPEIKAGKWGMLTDFVNGFAFSPLDGLQELMATTFPNLTETLDQVQNSEVINAIAEFGDAPILCTYHGLPGFHLPTPAEANRIRENGSDFLGHDMVLHLILSHAMGCRVSALVLAGAQILPSARPRITREDMLETGVFCSKQLRQGLRKAIREMEDAADGYAENLLPDTDADELIHASIKSSATRSSPLKSFLRPPREGDGENDFLQSI